MSKQQDLEATGWQCGREGRTATSFPLHFSARTLQVLRQGGMQDTEGSTLYLHSGNQDNSLQTCVDSHHQGDSRFFQVDS